MQVELRHRIAVFIRPPLFMKSLSGSAMRSFVATRLILASYLEQIVQSSTLDPTDTPRRDLELSFVVTLDVTVAH